MLQAARGVRGFVLEVQVNAVRSKGGQAQRDQVGVGTALVVGFDAGDGFVEPGGGEGHGGIDRQCHAIFGRCLWQQQIFSGFWEAFCFLASVT